MARRVRLILDDEAYEAVLAQAREFGVEDPEVAMSHAISVGYCIMQRVVDGHALFVATDGHAIRQLHIEHPIRRGQPLVPTDNAEGVWLLGEDWPFGEPKRGDQN